ncbi:hypothetical protein C357_09632 [Citreicella sp. 357]|nr:hypothetical protein C357_09632 [Citreicella sp. 357]
MTRFVTTAALTAATFAATALPAATVTFDLFGSADYFEFGGDSDLVAFDQGAVSFDYVSAGALTADFSLGYAAADATPYFGSFTLYDEGRTIAESYDLLSLGQSFGVVTADFGGLTALGDPAFGTGLSFTFAFDDFSLGDTPLSALTDGNSYAYSGYAVSEPVSTVPLPAGVALLLTGLGALGLRRKRG